MKQKDILIIFVLLFIFVVAWIGSSLYHSVASSTISSATSQDISPIKPTFDTNTIDKLRQRQQINPSFEVEEIKPTSGPIVPLEILFPQDSTEEAKLAL